MTTVEVFAPAKINLTLHVTGQRADGYHLLDSLVAFASVGDHLTVTPAPRTGMTVTGPFAQGVPADPRNLCWRAAEMFGESVQITLDKHLPHPAGIGGGSSDAAAVLRAMERLFDRPFQGDLTRLGADVPVCYPARAARMAGIGERVDPVDLPRLNAVLVNPGIDLPTPAVFKALTPKDNPPMPPMGPDLTSWLPQQRNDLEAPAQVLHPVVSEVLQSLSGQGAWLARMSGSGATCFALFDGAPHAAQAADTLAKAHPAWWVRATTLG